MSAGGTKLKPVDKVWLDGNWSRSTKRNVHVLTHTLHYGVGAFEGIRCYKRADGRGAIFRLAEHIDRLFDSCHICTMDVPYTREQIIDACVETLRANKMDEAYLRPIVFLGDGALGLGSLDNPVRVGGRASTSGAPTSATRAASSGIRAKVSSFTRGALNSTMSKGKICGQYVNSVLAKREAHQGRLRRGDPARRQRSRRRGLGREHLHRQEAAAQDAAAVVGDPGRHHARHGHHARARARPRPSRRRRSRATSCTSPTRSSSRGTAAELTPVREIDDRQIGAGEVRPVSRAGCRTRTSKR